MTDPHALAEEARKRCEVCGVEQPTADEWGMTEEGCMPELCWGSWPCEEFRRETFARIAAVKA